MKTFDFSTYLSPFTWRYGSDEMRRIFSEKHKYEIWRELWVTIAKHQATYDLVTKEELADLMHHQHNIDFDRITEIEKETRHDVVAAIKEFAEKAKIGGRKIHLGATSMDIVDNADAVRLHEALLILEKNLKNLLLLFGKKITTYAQTPCMGYTHLQPAEPTTIGYRFALYAQDLLYDYQLLQHIKPMLKTKGMKGAVGTAASYSKLVGEKNAEVLENDILRHFNLDSVLISGQTTPRKIDYFISVFLSSLSQSLAKFALDLRVMQSPGFGEWQEPFATKQVGSSAMPFKKNPMKAEQICSLARLISALSHVAEGNSSNSILERTLDDSANRRVYIPELFLATDEILNSSLKIIDGIIIHEKAVEKNLRLYGPFSATEEIILEAVKNGANRQEMHELLRELSMKAWTDMQNEKENPLPSLLERNTEIKKYFSRKKLLEMLNPKHHIGTAPKRALLLVEKIKTTLKTKR